VNGLPYYKRYPRDFIEGTIGMPFELKVTYSFVLDLIYMQGGNLPDDPRYISGLLGVSVRKWNSLRSGLLEAGKIQTVEGDEIGYLTNYRAVIELESLAKLSRTQSVKRSRPNKNKDLESPQINHLEPEPDKEDKRGANAPPKKAAAKAADGDDLPEGFEEFWALVTIKASKPKCVENFRKAVKAGADPLDIISGMRRYRDWLEALGQNAPRTKYPQGWLTEERWNDDLPDPSTQTRSNGKGTATHGQLAKINDWFRPDGCELDSGSGGVNTGRKLPDDGRRGEADDPDRLGFGPAAIPEAAHRTSIHGPQAQFALSAEASGHSETGSLVVIAGGRGSW
jgi:uncharacterized protein YdaU (DUF1376 family)